MLTIPRPFHCSIKPLAKPLDKSNFAEAKSLNVNIRKDLSLFVTEENLRLSRLESRSTVEVARQDLRHEDGHTDSGVLYRGIRRGE